VFGFGRVQDAHSRSTDDVALLTAMKATGGRTLLKGAYRGLIEPTGLSEREKMQHHRSKKRVDAIYETSGDVECYNIWAPLWGQDDGGDGDILANVD
jgi:hypothetical protein